MLSFRELAKKFGADMRPPPKPRGIFNQMADIMNFMALKRDTDPEFIQTMKYQPETSRQAWLMEQYEQRINDRLFHLRGGISVSTIQAAMDESDGITEQRDGRVFLTVKVMEGRAGILGGP